MNEILDAGSVTLSNKFARAIWYIVWILLFRPFGTKLFLPWRLLLLKIFGADVKWDSGVYSSTKIWAPWNLTLGHNAWLGPNVVCYNQAAVILHDNVTVSQYSYICTAGHDIGRVNNSADGLLISPITFYANSWIGTRAFISMGVTIGEGAVVGATSSVYKDVEPWTVVGGNPAKFIKRRVLKDAD